MALSANTVWEVRTTGSDTNGGGFVTGSGGTDYSQQDSPQLSVTDAACTGNTTVTSTTGGFTAAMVGSIMYLSSGPGWYQITARASGNSITIDRNGPNASGMTANVGGAFASPAVATNLMADGMIAYLKYSASDYLVTTTTPGVANGLLVLPAVTTDTKPICLVGYDTTRALENSDANRPKITASGSITNCALVDTATTSRNLIIRNLIANGANKTGLTGFSGNIAFGTAIWENCKATSCPATGFSISYPGVSQNCEADSCGTGFTAVCCFGCNAHNCTSHGFSLPTNSAYTVMNCIAANNGGKGFVGTGGGGSTSYSNCIAYGNTSDGFDMSNAFTRGCLLTNCIAANNGGWGVNSNASFATVSLISLATKSNTSGNYVSANHSLVINAVSLSADPFTNAAGGDFSLNNAAGGGAACRAAGFPGVFPGGTTTGYLDIGAVQHQDSGGGSGPAGRPVVIQNIGTY